MEVDVVSELLTLTNLTVNQSDGLREEAVFLCFHLFRSRLRLDQAQLQKHFSLC